jgi:hypothetical protein
MKKSIFVFIIFPLLSLFVSCACFFNDTGTLWVENKSQRGLTYSVLVDNINYGTVGPGQRKSFEDIPAGDRILVFEVYPSGQIACQPAVVHIPLCSASNVISCDY